MEANIVTWWDRILPVVVEDAPCQTIDVSTSFNS